MAIPQEHPRVHFLCGPDAGDKTHVQFANIDKNATYENLLPYVCATPTGVGRDPG